MLEPHHPVYKEEAKRRTGIAIEGVVKISGFQDKLNKPLEKEE